MKRYGKDEILKFSAEDSIILFLDDVVESRVAGPQTDYFKWLNLCVEWVMLSSIEKLWWRVTKKWQKKLSQLLK